MRLSRERFTMDDGLSQAVVKVLSGYTSRG